MIEIKILQFDPILIEIPSDNVLTGEVRVVLPPINLKVLDLSMGGLLPGAGAYADVPLLGINIDLGEHEVRTIDFVDHIIGAQDSYKNLHSEIAKKSKTFPALLGGV